MSDNTPEEIFGKQTSNPVKEIVAKLIPDIQGGCLHNHSVYSIYDGAQTPEELVVVAKEAGYKSVALSDHGTLMGLKEFLNACKKHEVNPVVGVELYFTDEKYPEIHRGHICVYALDNEGVQSVIKILAESFKNFEKTGKRVYPITNFKILEEHVNKGHVFLTTACVNGVLSQELLGNPKYLKEYEKLKAELNELNGEEKKRKLEEFIALEEEKEKLKAQISSLKPTTLKPLQEKLKLIPKSETQKRKEGEEYIQSIRQENERIKFKKQELKEELEKVKEKLTSFKKSELNADIRKFNELTEKISSIPYVPGNERWDRAINITKKFIKIFSKSLVFVELQNHGLDTEKEYFPKALEISRQLKLKTVVANDAHFDKKNSTLKRWLIKSEGTVSDFKFVAPPEYEDTQLYVKPKDELIEIISEIIDEKEVRKAYKNTDDIMSKCKVDLKKELHFPIFKPPDGLNSKDYLRKLTIEGAKEKYGDIPKEVEDRINYELEVIDSMGYNDYILIVRDYIMYAKEKNPILVGPGRGSGAGSIVNYLIGITEGIDPLKYELIFERFLNPSRVSMPKQDWAFIVNPILKVS